MHQVCIGDSAINRGSLWCLKAVLSWVLPPSGTLLPPASISQQRPLYTQLHCRTRPARRGTHTLCLPTLPGRWGPGAGPPRPRSGPRSRAERDGAQQLRVANGSPRPGPALRVGWGRRPLGRLRVPAADGEGPAQVARLPPGSERGVAAAGWGGSGPAASSCSPPAWGSAGSAGRSEVRAPQPPLPVPSPDGHARSPLEEGGRGRAARGAWIPLYSGGLGRRRGRVSPAATATWTLRQGLRAAGVGVRSALSSACGSSAQNLRLPPREARPLGSRPVREPRGRALRRPRHGLHRGLGVSGPGSWCPSDWQKEGFLLSSLLILFSSYSGPFSAARDCHGGLKLLAEILGWLACCSLDPSTRPLIFSGPTSLEVLYISMALIRSQR